MCHICLGAGVVFNPRDYFSWFHCELRFWKGNFSWLMKLVISRTYFWFPLFLNLVFLNCTCYSIDFKFRMYLEMLNTIFCEFCVLSNFDFYCFVGCMEELRVLHVLTVRGCEEVETILCISLKREKDSDVSSIQ